MRNAGSEATFSKLTHLTLSNLYERSALYHDEKMSSEKSSAIGNAKNPYCSFNASIEMI